MTQPQETTLERLARAYMRGFYGARNEQTGTSPPTEAELEGVATLLQELREPTEETLRHVAGDYGPTAKLYWQGLIDHILSEDSNGQA